MNRTRLSLLGILALGTAACQGEEVTPPPAAVCGDAATICTVAGSGVRAFRGEGDTPERVAFYFPIDAVFDGEDRLVVLDWNNFRVRRLDHDGRFRTIVGTGLEDTVRVHGVPALQTSLHHAYSLAYDGGGNLFIAGFHVPWVLRVTPAMLAWVAAGSESLGYAGDGGPALEAKLGLPTGVAVGSAGTPLFISDADHHCVRFVDADGVIHTLAGTGEAGYEGDEGPAASARLRGPYRVRYDEATGDVYICDTGNDVVRRVDGSGVITTVAGTGVGGYGGDDGPAIAARLETPMDARRGPDGGLYIADYGNHRVRRVDASGRITTVAGAGRPGYSGDGGSALTAELDGPAAVCFDAAGNLYVTDTQNSVVRKIVLAGP
jgi:hypothetical protein